MFAAMFAFLVILYLVAIAMSFVHNFYLVDAFHSPSPLPGCVIHLVVARYREDLDWLNELPTPNGGTSVELYIYNKGPYETKEALLKTVNTGVFSDIHIIDLPNKGRCDHTYIHHIVSKYDHLPDVCVFLPGSAKNPRKWDQTVRTVMAAYRGCSSAFAVSQVGGSVKDCLSDFQLSHWKASEDINFAYNPTSELVHARYRPFGKWFDKHFYGEHDVSVVVFAGIFAVHKSRMQRRPIEFYKDLLDQLSVADNVEVGHYMERSWLALFAPTTASDYT